MSHLPKIVLLLCLLICMVFSSSIFSADSSTETSTAKGKPNVLFIAVDDLRCELGCYGVDEIITPNIDALSANAVTFTRAYCQLAVCNPSRVSVMTGMRPDNTQVWDLRTEFRTVIPNAVTMPQHFRKHGYHAVSFGKVFHNPWPDQVSWDEPHAWPEKAGLWSEESKRRLAKFRDEMRNQNTPAAKIERMRGPAVEVSELQDSDHIDGAIADQAIAALSRLSGSAQPFFVAAGFVRPHLPFVVPRAYWQLYQRSDIKLATNRFLPKDMPTIAFGLQPQGGFYELRDYMDYADATWPMDGSLTDDQQRELKHGYYAAVSFIDAQVGRLIKQLEQSGLADNTIVVLWSDHGWKLGDHNGWCKQTNFEIDTRVPLLIRAPKAVANGQSLPAIVELVDIFPTLCELTGLPIPDFVDGESLAPILNGTATEVKQAAISQFPRSVLGQSIMGYAMRTDRYRYLVWIEIESGKVVEQELYDHQVDPEENTNVANQTENAELLGRLNTQLWEAIPNPVAEFNELLKTIP